MWITNSSIYEICVEYIQQLNTSWKFSYTQCVLKVLCLFSLGAKYTHYHHRDRNVACIFLAANEEKKVQNIEHN